MIATKKKLKTLPARSKVKASDTWDLASLYPDDAAWETDFAKWEKYSGRYASFRGTLGDSAAQLAKCLSLDITLDRLAERLGTYAFLKTTEDTANSDYQRMMGRYQHAASEASQAASFIRPEILAIPSGKFKKLLQAKPLQPHRITLERLVRYKPHTLTDGEERLLAMQSQMSQTANQTFRQLTDADFKFGMIKNESGESVELSHSSFSALLHSPKRSVRRVAFDQYYDVFAGHENALAATLSGSVQRDVYYAKARGYESAIQSALFADNVPLSVYDNLIAAVRSRTPAIYRYLDLRRRKMRLKDIHQYDTYVPILSGLDQQRTWKQAVDVVIQSIAPLGDEYCRVLLEGLTAARWCDRYPNRGKQSGAFSCGTFDGAPYILMNYQPTVLDHVFTLAHEAGHSMHSYYSAKSQPFQYYDYTIFVAEVASTFNEQLLSRHLMQQARSDQERAYLINRDIDAIRGTIIRQTMFAEFEKVIHALAESGEPLTVECFKSEYAKLLEVYFGPDFVLDEQLKLECLRIPHFYRAFYVYKYATGLSAAIALSERVLNGGQRELGDYLGFLQGGCSKYPLDLLRDAGVDMTKPEPVETALDRFAELVDELDELL
jgi:oligoendopeptidase F